MGERLEDEIFASALEASGIKLTKKRYTEAEYPHKCTMCTEKSEKGYKLKPEYVAGYTTPYLYICRECYEELPKD